MRSKNVPPEAQMMQFILAKWISRPIHAAAKLGIPDILADGERPVAEISEKTKTHTHSLYRLMRALSSVGIFAETGDRIFKNTPLSECLTEGRLRAAAILFHSRGHDRMWEDLSYTIETGKPAFEKVHGKPAFQWLEDHPEEAAIFHKTHAFKSAFSHRAVVEVYDFAGIEMLTDVGGGFGGLMIEILKAAPRMKGTVADLPETVAHLPEIIRAADLEGRMTGLACDFLNAVPGHSNACLLSHVLHDWPDDECITILKNCRRALEPGGRLLIVEGVVTPGNTFCTSKLMDLEVLLMGGGCERTKEAFEDLMAQSGFHFSRMIPAGEGLFVIEGVAG